MIEIDMLQGIPYYFYCIETERDGMNENKQLKYI